MRARDLARATTAIAATAAVWLSPAVALGSNLQVHGVSGANGSACALADGTHADAGMSVTCGNGNGTNLGSIYLNGPSSVPSGSRAYAYIDAPAGVLIDEVSVNYCSNMNSGVGWGGGSFWGPSAQYGGQWPAATCTSNSTGQVTDYPEGVPRYGFQIVRGSGGTAAGYAYVPSFTVFATESAAPTLTAVGTDNIWYHAASWLWNPPSDPWNATLVGTDTTGVCKYQWSVGSASVGQNYPQNQNAWQQCPNNTAWSTSVDTDAYPNGPATFQVADWNAANVPSSDTETLHFDNQAPTVSLNPSVGRASSPEVTVGVAAAAGPSGVASLGCTDNGAALPITAGTVSVRRNGTHRIDCSVANNAIDPQGQHNAGSATLIVQISTSRIPVLSRRRAHGRVNVPVVIGWSWYGAQTIMRHVSVGRLSRRARVTLACAGARCPFKRLSASRATVNRLERRLAGSRLRSGDVLTLTIAVPGRRSERALVHIRNNRSPLVRRVS